MLTKRIIPCLDIADGQTVKGVNFVDIRDAGDPVELGKSYVQQGADELVFLDITATIEDRQTFALLVEKIALNVNIPFTVGGGIRAEEDVSRLLDAGADPNAQIIRAILNGEKGPKRDMVVLNAGAAFVAAGLDEQLKSGIERAGDAIDSGQAQEKLDSLVAFTQQCGFIFRK